MAHTARSEEDKKEYFDSPKELEKKVDQLAALVKKSKHFIAFTVRCVIRLCSWHSLFNKVNQSLYPWIQLSGKTQTIMLHLYSPTIGSWC